MKTLGLSSGYKIGINCMKYSSFYREIVENAQTAKTHCHIFTVRNQPVLYFVESNKLGKLVFHSYLLTENV